MKKQLLVLAFLMVVQIVTACGLVTANSQEAIDYNAAFLSISALSSTVIIVVDFLKNLWPTVFKGNFLRWFSYLLPIGLAFIASWRAWGMFAELPNLWYVLAAGALASVGSWFGSYIGIANMLLQVLGIDLKGYRARMRNT